MESIRPTRKFIAGRAVHVFADGTVLPIVAGGDGPTVELPEELRNRMADLAGLNDEELGTLEGDLIAHLDEVVDVEDVTDEVIATATAVRDAINQVRADAERRFSEAEAAEQAAAERRAQLEAIRDEVAPEEQEQEAEGDAEGDAEGEESEGDSANEAEGEEQPPEGEAEADAEEREQEAVAAGAQGQRAYPRPNHRPPLERVAARRRRSQAGRQSASERPRVSLIAAADLAGFAAGQPITDQERLAEAIIDRAEALRSVTAGADGMKYLVARGLVDYPEERRLSRMDSALSDQRIDAAMGPATPRAQAASGGLCAPLMPDYTQVGISDDSRPGRGALTNFQADRGGVIHMPPPRFSRGLSSTELAEDSGAHDFSKGVGQWTEANDVALNNPATKPIIRVDCEEQVTDKVYAVTQRLEIGNFYNMTFPERVRAIVDILNAQHASLAEQLLIKTVGDGSKHVTAGQGLGATRDILAHLDVAVAAYENRWRMAENHPPLEFWLPDWVHDLIRADSVRAMVSGSTDERLAKTDAQIDAFFDARNVNVTWLMDGEPGASQDFGAQADNAALAGWPTSAIGYLWHQGAWAFMDNGTIDLGIIRDSVLADTNDLQMFRETFEGAFFRGWESLRISMDVCPSGESQGTASFDPCATGS